MELFHRSVNFKESNSISFESLRRLHLFLLGAPMFTKSNFPDDLDTTSLAAVVLGLEEREAHQLLDRMLEYVNEDDLISVIRSLPYYMEDVMKLMK